MRDHLGQLPRISNARWLPNRGFSIDVETVDGRPPTGGHRVVWKSSDGRSSGHATLVMPASRHAHAVPMPLEPGRVIEIWIETEPPQNGQKLANVVTLK